MNNPPKVYLGGIISGLTFEEANLWREEAIKKLARYNIIGASPLRGKDHLKDTTVLHKKGFEGNVMSTQRGITTRDRWDVRTSDVIIMNLLNAKTASIGCSMEVAWADMLGIPVILIIEKDGNPHEHAMLLQCVGYRVETVDQAIEVARKVLIYD